MPGTNSREEALDTVMVAPGHDPRDRTSDEYWYNQLRPLSDAATAAAMLRIDEDQLAILVENGHVLALPTGDGFRFPGFQFSGYRTPLPHLHEAIQQIEVALRRTGVEAANPWFVAFQLNSKSPVWGDRSAAELLRTDQADEVLWQLAWERTPLEHQAENVHNMEIARPIAERISALIRDTPVRLRRETLYVTVGLAKPLGVVAFASRDGVRILRFTIDGDPELIAEGIAADLWAAFGRPNSTDRGRLMDCISGHETAGGQVAGSS
jgi:hypothetical protein